MGGNMRLRNKKTGEVREDSDLGKMLIRYAMPSYDSIAELCEEWEDYKPADPLIKDEKIRKAVRAWAETVFEWGKWTENKIRVGYEGDDIYCFKIFDCLFEVPLSEKEKISDKEYTIAELCGEEEK